MLPAKIKKRDHTLSALACPYVGRAETPACANTLPALCSRSYASRTRCPRSAILHDPVQQGGLAGLQEEVVIGRGPCEFSPESMLDVKVVVVETCQPQGF